MPISSEIPENRYLFRHALPGDEDPIAEIEQICFRPEAALPRDVMRRRARQIPDMFLLAVCRNGSMAELNRSTPHTVSGPAGDDSEENNFIAGYITALATDEESFRDEYFYDPSIHNPSGRNLMLLGLEVLPGYRHRGIAGELIRRVRNEAHAQKRSRMILTCEEEKIPMYEKFGFRLLGISGSELGGITWYEMESVLS